MAVVSNSLSSISMATNEFVITLTYSALRDLWDFFLCLAARGKKHAGASKLLSDQTLSEDISIISSEICELKSCLVRIKETNLRQFTCANEKVRAADDEMATKKLEDSKLCSRYQENGGTTPLLLASERKCSQVERKNTHISNVVKTIPEDGYRKMQDDLKLKNDQFNDLVKAHHKLRYEFRTSELKWKIERLQFHHKISGLEWDLRAKSVSYDLLVIKQGICKLSLTIKLDKEKLYEYIYMFQKKCREQQLKIVQKDDEIVNLRYVFTANDILVKGMELKNHKLRQQKEDILKELQKERAANLQSLSKLKKRLFNLRKEHGSCSTKLELKETEWRSQLQILKAGAGCSDACYSKLLCENKNMHGVMKIEEISECEMAEKTHERNSIDAGSQSWENDDEVPKSSFEGQLEIEQASDQEIENLKSAVKEHEEKIGDLQHQVTSLELISPATYTMVEEQNL